ncbi:ABC transporter substrate-binding protein [Actinomadura sp. WMMB 499]|uniref:ABC transporter substrate-binding protein n=1 Tax=Actinomadura sp. WMMB 499 TaxID=1219491 RepID=UPI0012461845|nr:extracellular solute-binding protein [Actinomadura sp. WMMB 499]QFG20230.1 extracellular solute-binding protein [Actinomadura sp. WMMB 499]
MKKTLAALAAAVALSLAAGGCGSSSGSSDVEPATDLDAATQKLVDDAKAAGPVTLYGMIEETALRQIASDFEARYGVKVESVRLVSGDLSQRFSTEASGGENRADLIMLTDSPFYDDALKKGWITSFADADLPAMADELPKKDYTHDGATPIVSFVPTKLVYNTDAVDRAPAEWKAYADPKFKGKILLAEPDSSPADIAFWSLMRQEYGDGFLRQIAANEPQVSGGAVPGTQAVAAGEADLGFPGVEPVVAVLKERGAPIDLAAPSPTTGPEVGLGLAANSPNPAGAKLLAAYLMSKEGNVAFNETAKQISPFDTGAMTGFTRISDIELSGSAELKSLLGVN